MYVQRGEEKIEMICLFGLDVLKKLGGRLELDVKNKSGKIIIYTFPVLSYLSMPSV